MDAGVAFIADLAVVLLTAALGAWAARSLRLTAVVGYLLAGVVVGAPEITVIQVTDALRVQIIAQVGLVFLMFSIGMRVRLREVRRLGWGPLVATVLTALSMLALVRACSGLLGLDRTQGLFFAAMLMVSSSAIIAKVLSETGRLHERAGQRALSHTLLEDFVAVVMLTVLGSVAAYEQAEAGGWGAVLLSLGKLGAFVILFVVTGLLVLPRLVRRLSPGRSSEQLVVLVAGLLFGLALLTVLAGYSLALGAFLCGLLVAELPHSRSLERAFSGMRDIFTAVFFVAVGMSIDLGAASGALGLIAVGTVLALAGRFLLAGMAWMLTGEDERTSLQTALYLTPIGEFSFIIAGLGVASGVVPESFQAAAVGIALMTSLLAPFAMQRAERVAEVLSPARFRIWRDGFAAYRDLWRTIGRRGGSNLLWRMLRPRLWQVGRELFWISAVLVFAQPIYRWAQGVATAGEDPAAWRWLLPWSWLLVAGMVLPALVALVRNLDAQAMLVADYLGMQAARWRRWNAGTLRLLRVSYGLALGFWLVPLLPWAQVPWLFLLFILLLAAGILAVGWRRFIRWHARAEGELRELVAEAAEEGTGGVDRTLWEAAGRDWGLQLGEAILPEHSRFAGATLGELGLRERAGVTVVGIERQGWSLPQPGPQSDLFPGDVVFVVGRAEEVRRATELLEEENGAEGSASGGLRRAILAPARVPGGSPLMGRTLATLNWSRLHGVQVVSARRGDEESANPGPGWRLAAGDELLLVGAEDAIARVVAALENEG